MTVCDSYTFAAVPLTNSAWHSLGFRDLPAGWVTIAFTIQNTVSGTGPHGPCDNYVEWKNSVGGLVSTDHIGAVASGSTGTFLLTPPPTTTNWNVISTPGAVDNSNAITLGIVVNCDVAGPTVYCAYGTEANPDAIYYEVITDSLIDVVVGAALAGTGLAYLIPYVETALAAIEGTVAFGIDCSVLPGAGPALDFPNLSTLSTETLHEWFQNAAWRFFCRCIPAPPGSDDPIPPPPPPIIPPVTVVDAQPPPVCDNADLCAYLLVMKEQLQTITAQLSYLRTDVRLIKNQHVPFGYVLGTLHSGLTGAGSLAVSGILGVSVELTTIPGSSGVEEGDPLALFGLGWITLGNADGWRLSTPLRHNPMWIDAAFSDTLVGYSFAPLVVANIQEVSRQP